MPLRGVAKSTEMGREMEGGRRVFQTEATTAMLCAADNDPLNGGH